MSPAIGLIWKERGDGLALYYSDSLHAQERVICCADGTYRVAGMKNRWASLQEAKFQAEDLTRRRRGLMPRGPVPGAAHP